MGRTLFHARTHAHTHTHTHAYCTCTRTHTHAHLRAPALASANVFKRAWYASALALASVLHRAVYATVPLPWPLFCPQPCLLRFCTDPLHFVLRSHANVDWVRGLRSFLQGAHNNHNSHNNQNNRSSPSPVGRRPPLSDVTLACRRICPTFICEGCRFDLDHHLGHDLATAIFPSKLDTTR